MVLSTSLFLITFTILCSCLPAAAQSVWTPRDSGTDGDLSGVIYGGGQFVSVGDPGVILTSPDGATWTTQESGTENSLRGVAYGNGLFLATGSSGTLLTSPDGVSWNTRDSKTGVFLSGAAFGNGTFVTVGGSGTVRYSLDGVTWESATVPSTAALQGVCFGGGKFVAVGSSGAILHSSDGQSWTLATSGTFSFDYFFSASYLSGTYVVVGQNGAILTSTDAVNWTRQAIVAFTRLRSITNNGSQFVAVGDPLPDDSIPGKVLTSTDGTNWTVTDLASDVEFNGISYGAETYIIVGGATGNPIKGLIFSSEDDLAVSLTFEDWKQDEFTEVEQADPLISGADADPDRDGIENFLEYALGLSPKISTPGNHEAVPKFEKSASASTITFMRPANRVGAISYSIYYSTDLDDDWLPLAVTEEIESEESGIQTVKFSDPDTVSLRKFYKLAVEEL